jgi:hypothetical protein
MRRRMARLHTLGWPEQSQELWILQQRLRQLTADRRYYVRTQGSSIYAWNFESTEVLLYVHTHPIRRWKGALQAWEDYVLTLPH